MRAVQVGPQFDDLLSPYAQASAWVHGLDPYSPRSLLVTWPADVPFRLLAEEVADGSLIAKRGMPTGYPLTSLVLLAPFSALSWTHAYAVWLTLNLFLFAVMLCVLVTLAGFSYRDMSALFLLAATLALAPFHTAIVTANVALVAVELGVVAFWGASKQYDVAAGILLAVSTGLKPQIGACFVLYYLIRRRWKVVGTVLIALAAIAAIGLLRLEFAHTRWLANYLNDNHVLLQTGILANFTTTNPTRFGLVNLQVVLYPLLGRVAAANAVSAALAAVLVAMWFYGMRRARFRPEAELLGMSTIAVISLLPIYHRFYDAALLALPVCWLAASWQRARLLNGICALAMLPFLIPGGSLLETLQAGGRIPAAWLGHWWWEAFVMPHEVWMLLVLSVLLLHEMIAGRTGAHADARATELRRKVAA